MLQSMGSQTGGDDRATEQQDFCNLKHRVVNNRMSLYEMCSGESQASVCIGWQGRSNQGGRAEPASGTAEEMGELGYH